jgi:two-component system, NtrC family, nitrogen regulation sensor histidine kinase NtrY
MKLSTKFILFIIVIHAVTIALSFYIFRENKIIFIASEFFIVISLMICWSLYTELIAPLNLLTTGIDALHDKDFTIKFVETGRYEMDKLIGVYNAMLDQLRTERTVQQEQYFFLDKLIQTSPTGILILDFDENIYDLNPKALSILNLDKEELKGRPLSPEGNRDVDSLHIFDNLLIKAIEKLEKGASTTVNTEGGKKFKIQKSAFIDRGFQRIFVMIEELTTEIFEAEKQAYAKVIRMMAHEVNNSIGAVNSILDTTYKMEQDADVANALKIAIERNDHLNYFMRNFADVIRLPEPRKEAFDVTMLVKNVATLMEYKAKEKHIDFEFQTNDPLSILADLGQIEQVLINIVKNAIEAQDKMEGFIIFKIDNNKRELSIIDNGKGISKDVEPMLFSPFFTNKNGGQGIGLTLIREVLTNHGFAFSLKTEKNNENTEGVSQTIFKIIFV